MYGKMIIRCCLVVRTGLHIGAGNAFSAIGAVDSQVVRDPLTGLPMIPGSSLKGKLRSLLARSLSKDIQRMPDFDQDDGRIKRLFGSANPVHRARLQFADCFVANAEEMERVHITEVKAENAIIPNDGARRVTVIRHAHNMNAYAQNALLKELEEPPHFAFFILTSEKPDALLQTVRSRCTRFALEPSGEEQAVSDDEATRLLAPYLTAVAGKREGSMMLAALGMEKTPRRALIGVMGVMQAALRDAIFRAEGLHEPPLQPALAKQSEALASALTPERLLAFYDFTDELVHRISRNAASAAVTCALTSDVYRICYQ